MASWKLTSCRQIEAAMCPAIIDRSERKSATLDPEFGKRDKLAQPTLGGKLELGTQANYFTRPEADEFVNLIFRRSKRFPSNKSHGNVISPARDCAGHDWIGNGEAYNLARLEGPA